MNFHFVLQDFRPRYLHSAIELSSTIRWHFSCINLILVHLIELTDVTVPFFTIDFKNFHLHMLLSIGVFIDQHHYNCTSINDNYNDNYVHSLKLQNLQTGYLYYY